jgi:hypothetical protein
MSIKNLRCAHITQEEEEEEEKHVSVITLISSYVLCMTQ